MARPRPLKWCLVTKPAPLAGLLGRAASARQPVALCVPLQPGKFSAGRPIVPTGALAGPAPLFARLSSFFHRRHLVKLAPTGRCFGASQMTTLKQMQNRRDAALRMASMGFPSPPHLSLDEEQSAALMRHYESGKHMTPQQALERLRASCQAQNSSPT